MISALVIGQSKLNTYYELSPLVPLTEWWHGLLLALILLAMLAFTVIMYYYDSVELPLGVACALGCLRAFAIITILVFFLNPQRNEQKQVTKTARVPILIDTSASMAGRDLDPATNRARPQRRIDDVLDQLAPQESASSNGLIESLREDYDVGVYRFDANRHPELISTFASRRRAEAPTQVADHIATLQRSELKQSRNWLRIAIVAAAMGLLGGIGYLVFALRGRNSGLRSFPLLFSVVAGILTMIGIAMADLNCTSQNLSVIAGLEPFQPSIPLAMQSDATNRIATDDNSESLAESNAQSQPASNLRAQLRTALEPSGAQTRLGESLTSLLRRERGQTLAGVLVYSDGQNTTGLSPLDAIPIAIDMGTRVFPIGVGNPNRPRDVRIGEIQAPQRIFPNDKLPIKAVIQAYGYAAAKARLELLSSVVESELPPKLEATLNIDLPADGEALPISFELEAGDIGQREFTIRIVPEEPDTNEEDNVRSVVVETIARASQVLLIAGGPNRDYRFLRNQLFRDSDVTLHIYLQSAGPGVSQESDELLLEFPSLSQTLDNYDCIIAFDPDWRELSDEQARLLEKWVAEKAGGLVVVAGPVYTPQWTARARGDATVDTIRKLYPVSFYSQSSASFGRGRFAGSSPFPLKFSREGRGTSFLDIGDDPVMSQSVWDEFPGVFGYYGVNETKPGAVTLAEFSDPQTAIGGQLPIYLATQFYGAGRVVFQASAEMWRLRAEKVEYFEKYYTKLIHWASQGRLLRDSRRGLLLVDKTQCFQGDTVTLQAMLRDPQDRPLELPHVDAVVVLPDGSTRNILLTSSGGLNITGAYIARYLPPEEGKYRIRLPLPGSADDEVLNVEFNVQIPLFEQQRPERNDAVLSELAEQTGGRYAAGVENLEFGRERTDAIENLLAAGSDQLQSVFLPSTNNTIFAERLTRWLLVLIVTALCAEWVLRRLHRLA